MEAAITHWRDKRLLDAFMIEKPRITQNIDGTETCRMTFPKELTVEVDDVVHLTYFLEK